MRSIFSYYNFGQWSNSYFGSGCKTKIGTKSQMFQNTDPGPLPPGKNMRWIPGDISGYR